MASHSHKHVDGKEYSRTFKTGRRKISPELKKRQQALCLSLEMRQAAREWRSKFGMSFSAWVEGEMGKKLYN